MVRGGYCAKHYGQADRSRGSARQRGYGERHRYGFRAGVLGDAGGSCVLCGEVATVADHWPLSRKQLLAAGEDADDPRHGRALCKRCHDRHTASTSIARRDV